MDAITTSAKFGAYARFAETAAGKDPSRKEAARFVGGNRVYFLGHVEKGLGRLLRITRPRRAGQARRRCRGAA